MSLREHLDTDRRLDTPLHRQLYHRFREAIAAGRFRPGDRVPSIRALASELNLARGTVELAYQELATEGYLLSRGAAGTVVSPHLVPERIPLAVAQTAEDLPQKPEEVGRLQPMPFQLGSPALDAVPIRLWRRLITRRLKMSDTGLLSYPDPRGDLGLRQALAGYLGVSRGIACDADQIIVTAGYCDSLSLICRTLLRQGDESWFEEPGYFQARYMLEAAGVVLTPIDVDDGGINVDLGRSKAERAQMAVVTPTHQSPTGVSLTLPRRQALLEWANDNESWIVEDDYDSEYRYRGRPIPALKSLDRTGRVLYAGTFSKVLFPGLRLAYLVVPPSEVVRFGETLSRYGHGCPQLPQAALADFIRDGHFARHLKRMRALYAQRRGYLQRALQTALSDRLSVELQAGGMHLLARCVGEERDVELAERAKGAGLKVEALSTWFADDTDRAGLLLGFTNIASEEDAIRLVSELKRAFDD
ncbi:PLP-dependent aminotransferase family protein [Endozoicomonas sp. G2_2]|uniref:MocR-like pyridoxine biosynthesis transcription factor PdxR n=1 Tax=Endozoicomonas sp. G2_2 TaxID=2821092 RepID=UPI001ADB661F|nr:PLP-dependent aminotransferase family protein [Endozoicomonas sp. G2_2]MBO9471640.1 PLP-dependent aminotransferase family protein [Endozoicomonas sp. G2_2]